MESLRHSDDFKELLSLFNDAGVRFLVVGGFALAHYGHPRYTKDLDLWIDPVGENPRRAYAALAKFGAPLDGVSATDLADPDCVFQVGVEPLRVDILNSISGVEFAPAWQRRVPSTYAGVPINVIGREDYIANKRATGRPHDLRDVAELLEGDR
ncbi:MAG: nucleotidyltransferase [Vulcanimicrobiaceae bacterium]